MTSMPLPSPRPAPPHRADTVACHARAVERVIASMHEHIEESFPLRDMADLAIMSPFHFNRTFRELTGVPPCQYLSAVRLAAAKRLLLTTGLSVTDVCFEVGYQSLGSFIRRFTELVGVSPRRLRNALGNGHHDGLGRPAGSGNGHAGVVAGQMALRGLPRRDGARPAGTTVVGRVTAPPGFEGRVFVGLFDGAMPQGRPAACTVLAGTGAFRITGVADGWYYLMALGMPRTVDPMAYYLCEDALRGGGQALAVARGVVTGVTHVMLRERGPLDPPILMALPRPEQLAVVGH